MIWVAPTAMDATLGGSSGIPTNPSLETGRRYIWNSPDPSLEPWRDEEKNLEKWRLRFLIIIEKGTTIEQVREEEKIRRVFFQKIRSYEEGRSEGVKPEFEHIPKIGEGTRRTLYEGIIRLMMYIDNMASWLGKPWESRGWKSNPESCRTSRKERDGEFNPPRSKIRWRIRKKGPRVLSKRHS